MTNQSADDRGPRMHQQGDMVTTKGIDLINRLSDAPSGEVPTSQIGHAEGMVFRLAQIAESQPVTLDDIAAVIDHYISAVRAESRAAGRSHAVTIDLDDEHSHFVLTDALREWASRQRHEADNELRDDPHDTTAPQRQEWAATADKLLDHIDGAL